MKNIRLILVSYLIVLLTACNDNNKEYVHIGPNWAALQAIQSSDKTFGVDIDVADSATVGEQLSFKVQSQQAGRLWIMQVGPNDQVSQIYPNELVADNQINAGQWKKIPAQSNSWSIEATQPTGASILAFIVTSPETDLSTVLNQSDKAMDKALNLVEKAAAWGLAKQVVEIR